MLMIRDSSSDILCRVMKSDMHLIGERISQLRSDMELTQVELAQMVSKTPFAPKVTQSQIANIENGEGRNLPSPRLLGGLAWVLQVSTDYLLGLTDDQSSYSEVGNQVTITVDDPIRREKLQGICDALRKANNNDLDFFAHFLSKTEFGRAEALPASQSEYRLIDELWMLVFMLAGADEAKALLDSGVPASPAFRRMVSLALAKNDKSRNG